MPSQINLMAIVIANLMGIAILFCIFMSSFWTTRLSIKGKKELTILLIVCGISCVADPVCFIADGKPGLINFILVFLCNTWLYFGNTVVSLTWILLISKRLGHTISKIHKLILAVIGLGAILLLIVNFFTPIVFSVNADNVYARSEINWIYYVMHILLMTDGLFVYLYVQLKTRNFRLFPVWAFIIPVALGMVIQGLFYGVSTINPFTMVAIACMTSCLQNDLLFTDKLTGLYNRYYLDMIEKKIGQSGDTHSMIMLDINRFKSINDVYGHNAGDKAIIGLSNVLRKVLKENGTAIRYAGDEFTIVINTQDEEKLQDIIFQIQEELKLYNRESGNPYELSVAFGYGKLDLKSKTMYEIVDMVDKLMYENKREHYRLEQAAKDGK